MCVVVYFYKYEGHVENCPDTDLQDILSALPKECVAIGGALKRCFDIGFSVAALLATLPLCVVVAMWIRLSSRGPVFYLHERIGLNGQRFKCIKFRTMRVDGPEILERYLQAHPDARDEYERTHKVKNDPRVIPGIGAVLRKLSLDELPQFINVLRGDMSVVGPRPITVEELIKYGDVGVDYLKARPGITGLWQISGRSNVSFERRVEIDKAYVDHWSFLRDLRIVFMTFPAIVNQDGAY